MRSILLIILIVLFVILIFGNKEHFINEQSCDWFNYEQHSEKCLNNTKCAQMGICRSNEECDTFPDIKCK